MTTSVRLGCQHSLLPLQDISSVLETKSSFASLSTARGRGSFFNCGGVRLRIQGEKPRAGGGGGGGIVTVRAVLSAPLEAEAAQSLGEITKGDFPILEQVLHPTRMGYVRSLGYVHFGMRHLGLVQ